MEGQGLQLIDTHAHIYASEFDEDRDDCIRKAREVGVEKILMPNIDSTSIDRMMESEEKYEDCVSMMGLHPCSVEGDFQKELYIVEDWLSKRDFIAVGEIGVDLYWDKTYEEQQLEAFKIQVDWAIKYDIPVAIHSRDSTDVVLKVLEKNEDPKLRGVFHCFGGSLEEARRITELGFKLGIGGVSTFKKGGLDLVLPEVDVKHLILETDCPYLAPTPHRGKRNEPSYVELVAERIAHLQLSSVQDVSKETSKVATALFGI